LILGSLLLALTTAGFLLLDRRPKAYVPGTESEHSPEITRALRRDLPADTPGVVFMDAAEESGLRFRHFSGARSTQLPEDMGSGAAWGDYDADGDPDLFLVNEAGPLTLSPEEAARSQATSRLFRNDGGGRFADVTAAAGISSPGWGMGAAWGDYDGDHDLDLVVTRFGTNLLFRNQGDGTFAEVSRRVGLGGETGFWTGASWADYDRDGDLDLYVCGYVRYAGRDGHAGDLTRQYEAAVPYTLNPSSYPPERNLLYRNEGGAFREVARASGVDNPAGRSLSAAWADLDSDGWPDLYVANDISDNALFRNLGNGRFADISHAAWVADYRGAMGLAVGDWNNDEDLDLFVTHWIAQENALYDNQKDVIAESAEEPLHFVDDADHLGLGQISLDSIGWGTDFLDYDNDGRLDIFAANGSTFQIESEPARLAPMKNQLFWNGGKARGYFELSEASGPAFSVENVGRGAAVADFDQDGDLDIVVVVNGGEARLLRNQGGNGRAWLRVVLRGPDSRKAGARRGGLATSSFANGARVRLRTAGATQTREVGGSSSYLSQSPPGEVWFGVGEAARVEWLEIRWPDGVIQTLRDLPSRARLTLTEGGEAHVDRAAGAPPDRSAPTVSIQANGPGTKEQVLRFWSTFREATVLRGKKDYAGAAARYSDALALDPTHEDSLYYLGQCLLEAGRFAEANAAWESLVAANPHSARGHLALGALLASPDDRAPRDLPRAERHFRRAHEINAEETGPMVRLGEVLIVRGRLEEAEKWLRSAARTNPKSVDAAFLAGYILWKSGDRDAATTYFRKAINAARAERPVGGVLGEGDRKGSQSRQNTAPPPLKDPMGKTLLGAFSETLKREAARSPGETDGAGLDEAYRPLEEYMTGSPAPTSRKDR
jgi:tetratricopeptide (TPR) repeat protein